MNPDEKIAWYRSVANTIREDADYYDSLANSLERSMDPEEQIIGLIRANEALEEIEDFAYEEPYLPDDKAKEILDSLIAGRNEIQEKKE